MKAAASANKRNPHKITAIAVLLAAAAAVVALSPFTDMPRGDIEAYAQALAAP
jgi:hypothetical protein